jgi:2-C-methyl-D-erythritol 4-phosphate cytidylyltransferase
VADTLRAADADGRFGATVSREGLYRMQTPQGFRRAWLEAAHAAADDDDPPATDDVALVHAHGHAVHLVPGDPRNVKLTTPGDWAQAQHLWPTWHADHAAEVRP